MKITYIIPSLNLGGAETQTLVQIDELIRRGISIQLVVLSGKIDLIDNVNSKVDLHILGINGMETTGFDMIKNHFKCINPLRNLLNSYRPYIVIGVLPVSHFIIRRIRFDLNFGTKVWVYHHSDEFTQEPPDTILKKIYLLWNRFKGRKVDDGHIYISSAVKSDIESNLQIKKGYILYNAIPNTSISNEKINSCLDTFDLQINGYIIIPGRLHRVKGHELFLETCADYLKSKNIRVVFAGYGDTDTRLVDLIKRYDLGSLVKITGRIDNSSMLSLIKGSKFVVIPSLQEGLGNVAIESLMMGKTVLSSNAGGLPEVIINMKNGYIFEKGDSGDLLTKFINIYKNFNYLEIPEIKLKDDYNKRFTIESQVDKLLTIVGY